MNYFIAWYRLKKIPFDCSKGINYQEGKYDYLTTTNLLLNFLSFSVAYRK